MSNDKNQNNNEDLLQQFSSSYGADALGGGVGLKGVRLSPSQYLGSPAIDGAIQALLEIYQNATDESEELRLFLEEQGITDFEKFRIIVKISKNDDVTVADVGRGVPADYSNEFKRPAMEAMFEEINVGGKGKGYVQTDKSAYRGKTIGKHGSGGACANACSDYFIVNSRVRRDKKHYQVKWENGTDKVLPTTLIGDVTDGNYGTTIQFRPSREVFEMYDSSGKPQDRFFNFEIFDSIFTEYAYSMENTITYFEFEEADGNKIQKVYDSEEFIPLERIKSDEHTNVYEHIIEDTEHDFQLRVVASLEKSGVRKTFLVSNMHRIQRGTTQVALEEVMKNWLIDVERATNEKLQKAKITKLASVSWLKRNHISSPISYCSFYLLIRMGNPHYTGQSKEELRVPAIQEILQEQLKVAFDNELAQLKREVVDYLAENAFNRMQLIIEEEKRAQQKVLREQARKEREELLGTADKHRTRGMSAQEQDIVTYARSENPENTIIFCCEGKTAKDALDAVRDVNYHTILSIDQRPTNVFIHKQDKLRSKDKYKLLYKMFFGTNEGNYRAVVLSTDRDADGALIESYLIGFLWMFFPHYLTDGKVYIFDTPKYAAQKGNEAKYFFSEKERDEFREEAMKNIDYQNPWVFSQFKGLGSIPSELLREMVQSGQYFVRIDPKTVAEGMGAIESFLSDKRYKRKLVLNNYGDNSMLYHNAMRESIISEHEIDFEINAIETQFSTTPDLSVVSSSTFIEREVNSDYIPEGYTSIDENEDFEVGEGDGENLI